MMFIDALDPVRIFLGELECNEYGGVFRNGDTYPLVKKVEVAQALAASSYNYAL